MKTIISAEMNFGRLQVLAYSLVIFQQISDFLGLQTAKTLMGLPHREDRRLFWLKSVNFDQNRSILTKVFWVGFPNSDDRKTKRPKDRSCLEGSLQWNFFISNNHFHLHVWNIFTSMFIHAYISVFIKLYIDLYISVSIKFYTDVYTSVFLSNFTLMCFF